MLNDEIVEEVRTIREAHAAKFGYDLRAIYEDLKKSEANHIAAGHPFVSAPQVHPVTNSTLQRTRQGRFHHEDTTIIELNVPEIKGAGVQCIALPTSCNIVRNQSVVNSA